MSSFSKHEVEAAIANLDASYTYDPPERWLADYEKVDGACRYLRHAQRAFNWVTLLGILAFICGAIAAFVLRPTGASASAELWLFAIAMMTFVPSLLFGLARRLAQLREPLLTIQTNAERALTKLRARAQSILEQPDGGERQ